MSYIWKKIKFKTVVTKIRLIKAVLIVRVICQTNSTIKSFQGIHSVTIGFICNEYCNLIISL